MHFILWALLVLFIGSMTVGGLVGGADLISQILGRSNPSTAIGIINGQSIPPDAFFNAVQQQIINTRNQGQEVDERLLDQIRISVWDNLVEVIVLNQLAEEYDINITSDDIYHHLYNFPPPFLQNDPTFQTDGVFDRSKYIDALENPAADEWRPIENLVREYLPRQKLYDQVKASVNISGSDVKKDFIRNNVNFTISGLVIQTNGIPDGDDVTPSDEEIAEYYQSHQDDFQVAEGRILSYVKWNLEPSSEDTNLVVKEAHDLSKRLRYSKEDFSELADEYTEDPGNIDKDGNPKGGDLGWFKRGQMVGPFEEAAFNAKSGDIVGPIESSFGYHIIWIRDKRSTDGEEEILGSHILLKVEMGPSTRENTRQNALKFTYDVEDSGYGKAVEINVLESTQLRALQEGAKYIPGFGFFSAPARFAFDPDTKLDDISDVILSDKAFCIFKLDSIAAAGTKPLENVKGQIQFILKKDLKMAKAEVIASDTYKQMIDGVSQDSIIKENDQLKLIPTTIKTLSSTFPIVGRNPSVIGALLVSEPGKILDPIELPNGYAILHFEKRAEFDSNLWNVRKETLYNSILVTRQNEAISEWLRGLKDNADIVDNRKFYF
tara:strand:- start:33628 stop:35445 length:1818 start_codon:yes stop_codon:yes gene_type:complete